MTAGSDYPLRDRETVAETPSLRVRVLTLGPEHSVPWHSHDEITDTFFCLEGPMAVETRKPEARHELQVGESLAVPPGQPHCVRGLGPEGCRFLIVQGVGTYNFVPEEV